MPLSWLALLLLLLSLLLFLLLLLLQLLSYLLLMLQTLMSCCPEFGDPNVQVCLPSQHSCTHIMLTGKVLQLQFSLCGLALMASCMKSYVRSPIGANSGPAGTGPDRTSCQCCSCMAGADVIPGCKGCGPDRDWLNSACNRGCLFAGGEVKLVRVTKALAESSALFVLGLSCLPVPCYKAACCLACRLLAVSAAWSASA